MWSVRCGATGSGVADVRGRSGWIGAHGGLEGRDELKLVAERRAKTGGHLFEHAAKPPNIRACRGAAGVLVEADYEGLHTPNYGSGFSGCLKAP